MVVTSDILTPDAHSGADPDSQPEKLQVPIVILPAPEKHIVEPQVSNTQLLDATDAVEPFNVQSPSEISDAQVTSRDSEVAFAVAETPSPEYTAVDTVGEADHAVDSVPPNKLTLEYDGVDAAVVPPV